MTDPKRILVCVTGLSPQIVTETLFALAVNEGWIPDRVCLITTAEGAKRVRLSLLSEEPGWFARLLADYSLPPIRFTEEDILVLTDAQGNQLTDIRSPADNERAADFIVETLRDLTADPECQLHVSIAGGRKTMGFYLGYALTLFGRAQDRLSHVLVSEPFESCWDFFYPTPYSKVINTRTQGLADAREAQVTLGEIPFVSLRHGLTESVLQGGISYAGAVEAARRSLAPPRLILDLEAKTIEAAGMRIGLEPTALALLSVFARRVLDGKPALGAPKKDCCDPDWGRYYLREYGLIKGDFQDSEPTRQALRQGMDGDYFSQTKSKLGKCLRKALGAAATAYLIDDGQSRPRKYSLKLDASAISYRTLAKLDDIGSANV